MMCGEIENNITWQGRGQYGVRDIGKHDVDGYGMVQVYYGVYFKVFSQINPLNQILSAGLEDYCLMMVTPRPL